MIALNDGNVGHLQPLGGSHQILLPEGQMRKTGIIPLRGLRHRRISTFFDPKVAAGAAQMIGIFHSVCLPGELGQEGPQGGGVRAAEQRTNEFQIHRSFVRCPADTRTWRGRCRRGKRLSE